MSVRRILVSASLLSALLTPAGAFAQAGTCHEPCREPGGYCDGGLVCTGGTCEGLGGTDCGTRGNPGVENPVGEIPGATVTRRNARNGLFLLEPIGGVREIPTRGNAGLGVFNFYFGLLYPWLLGMAGGVVMLNAVWGGIKIIQAGSGDGVTEGKNKLLLSFAGLLIILFSAVILNTLNPVFFR